MFEKKVRNIEVYFDEEGYLKEPSLWNEEIGCLIAQRDGLSNLTEKHWQVIMFVRRYYEARKIVPMIRRICKETGLSFRDLCSLFPNRPVDCVYKIAGLRKPEGCV